MSYRAMAATHDQQARSPPQSLPSIASLTNHLPSGNSPRHSAASSARLSDRHLSGSGYSIANSQRFSSATTFSNSSLASTRQPPRDSGYQGSWFDAGGSKPDSISGHNFSSILNHDDGTSSTTSTTSPSGTGPGPTTPPVRHSQTLPSINQGFEASFRASGEGQIKSESRCSSVDSRVHNGLNSLALHHPQASPYEPQQHGARSSSLHGRRPPSPSGSRHSGTSGSGTTRVAPPIQPNPRRVPGIPDPTASKPTAGFPWAFPDTSSQRKLATTESPEAQDMSRQNSVAASSVRSVFSLDNPHMPHGQRRFEDGMAFQKIIGHDSKLEEAGLQNGRPTDSAASDAAFGVGNYSRTPELRVSHKLAERKRRSEMKDLFEELNRYVPNNGGAKSSKWEILTKAIDYIKTNQEQAAALQNEMHRLQATAEYAREAHKEIESLRTEVYTMVERLQRLEPNAPHIYGKFTSELSQQAQGQQSRASQRPSAASALSYTTPPQHSSAMQGVEYGAHAS